MKKMKKLEHNTKKHKKEHVRHVIDVSHVSFRYPGGADNVLDDISFSVKAGDYVGILGPNGSGKSTLLKLLLGLLHAERGSIQLFGRDLHHTTNRYKIGYVPQRSARVDASFPATVEEVVTSGLTARLGLFQRPSLRDRQMVTRTLRTVHIERFRNRLLSDLSGGELQRVFIARALAPQPRVLILDEPTTGIDIGSQEDFYKLLRDLNREHGLTILFVSHDVDVITREVNSVICVNRSLVYHGAPKDFLTEKNMQKLYGRSTTLITHRHAH
jgi:zinc transport system ATP-binding protein